MLGTVPLNQTRDPGVRRHLLVASAAPHDLEGPRTDLAYGVAEA
jgi:hypothetical protein